MGFLLYIVSLIIKRFFEPFMYIFGSIMSLFKGEWNQYNTDLAIATDQYGNGLSKYLFNLILITKFSLHKFGNIDETISSVIGKNKLGGTLTWLGHIVDILLNTVDPEHSIKAIDNTES
jgi:hypothetical protein